MRPRLLIVITLAEVGGAQTYVALLLPELVRHFDVVVAAHGEGPLRAAASSAGVRFVPLRNVRRQIGPRDLLGLLELFRLFRRERPLVVHLNSSKAGVLGRIAGFAAGVPIRIFTVHGWSFDAHSGAAAKLYLLAERAARSLTTVIICVSETARANGLRARTCRADRTVVIRNAVELRNPARNSGDAMTEIVAVGRFKAPKDYVTLVRALARLKTGAFHARIVGDGPDRTHVESEIRRLGLADAVELMGEREDVDAFLDAADVFVLSSRSEGLPLSLLEAMAAALPVVASAVGGVPEVVVDGETGTLVPPEDAEALSEALARLIESPELRERFGKAGRARVESEFSLEGFRERHLEVYGRALAARGLPRPDA